MTVVYAAVVRHILDVAPASKDIKTRGQAYAAPQAMRNGPGDTHSSRICFRGNTCVHVDRLLMVTAFDLLETPS